MQVRTHDAADDRRRVWLSASEADRLVAHADDTEQALAIRLGLHGLRVSEILSIDATDVSRLDGGGDQLRLLAVDAKDAAGESRERAVPVRADLGRSLQRNLTGGFSVSTTTTVRRWVQAAADRAGEGHHADGWEWVTPHDLRRTYASRLFYSLATAGVPAAELLVMSWGGWAVTEVGRSTFRDRYLGPVPERVAADTLAAAGWV